MALMPHPDDPLNQQEVPPSFVALFVPPGRIKPVISREELLERYGFCEDLAQLLTETAQHQRHSLHLGESDVLERVGQGLTAGGAMPSEAEAQWVVRRLAELLDWPAPA